MRILVDIGNSRCKSAIEDEDGLSQLETFVWKDVFLNDVLERVWLGPLNGRIPASIFVANVAGDQLLPNMSAWCCRQFGVEPVAVESTGEFRGLYNGYRNPSSLGVDRWAAMIGARRDYQGALCIIDSGTATTIDLVDAAGRHRGGAILPGIYTMRRSLGKYTSALFAADGTISAFADNTAGGIAGGTGFASAGAMDRFVSEASEVVNPLTTIITGGESVVLESLMNSPVIRDPLLVLKGVSVLGNDLRYALMDRSSSCMDLPVN